MKTFQLKLISILISALAMAANTNAEIMLSVDGSTNVDYYEMPMCSTVWIDVYSTDSTPYICWIGIVDEQGNDSYAGAWTGNYVIYPEAGGDALVDSSYLPNWWLGEAKSFDPYQPVWKGKQFDFEFHMLGFCEYVYIELWDFDFENVLDTVTIFNAFPYQDLGDAPDSTNNFGLPMTTYPGSGVQANYPTVYNDGNNLNPRGPFHQEPSAVAYLGQGVTSEYEADFGGDEDPNNNIEPQSDTANQDGADDCIKAGGWLYFYGPETFDFNVTVVTPNIPLYANVWFDWNQDGDWDDSDMDFCGQPAPEWAVQNQELLFPKAGFYRVTSDAFTPWWGYMAGQSNIWMRITLSEQPWTGSGSGGSGPVNGYQYGETEDHVIQIFFPIFCFPAYHPDFCEWLDVDSPVCWCYPRQCHGDTDDMKEGNSKTGYYYVHFYDLTVLQTGWNIKEPPKGPGIKWPDPNVCADFAHDVEGSTKTGYYRVHFNDLSILLANWSIKEPPHGSGIEPNCFDVP